MNHIFRLLFISLLPFASLAQQKMLSVEDAVLKQRTTLGPEKLSMLSWIPGSNSYTWIAKANGRECMLRTDAASLKTDSLLYSDAFKQVLMTVNPEGAKAERFPPITWVDMNSFRVFYEHVMYLYNIQTKSITPLVKLPKDADETDYEPVTNRCAAVVSNNLMVLDKSSLTKSAELQNGSADLQITKKEMITTDGVYGVVNGKAVHRNEFGIMKGTFWSPKGNKLAYYKMYEGMVTDYPVLELDRKPAISKPFKYPMAGNNSHQVKIWVQDFSKDRYFELQTGLPAEQYLTNITWSPDEEYLYVAIVNRDQNEMKLNVYDGITGAFLRTLFTEKHAKYVEPKKPVITLKNKPSQFLWFSKRDGFNHLYLYDIKGKLIKQVTKGTFDVTEFTGFDKTGNTIYFVATGNNGLERQLFSADLNTGKTVAITRNAGMHSVMMSDDGSYFLDSYSNVTTPKRITLMDKTGGELSIILNSKNPIADYNPCGIRLFSIPTTDKTTQLNCRMFYPPQFDSTKKYPVLVYVYGGPQVQMVTNSWLGGADMWLYYMAQQGYIIFTLDNRGSDNRGLEFENAVFRKLGTLEREDQFAGATYLKNQRYVDSTRMGVFGWSYGGFMSINMMTRTNAFKVGVAGGPVIDWSMYEVMYTERYMDKPQDNKEGYDDANLMNYVKNLKGKLLVIHGTSDDLVVWQHSLNYIKKCIDEGVQVDYFVYPGHKHNVLGKDRVHLMQKVADYFKQNL